MKLFAYLRPRRLIAAGAAAVLLATGAAALAAEYQGYPTVRVVLNGVPVVSDVPAIILGGRTLLPVRAIAEALHLQVSFDAATSTVSIAGADPATLKQQLAANQTKLAGLTSQAEGARAKAKELQAGIAQAGADTAVAQTAAKDLQAQAAPQEAQLADLQKAVAGVASGAGIRERRDALQSAMFVDAVTSGALTGITPAIGTLESRFINFVRTWELKAPASETLVLKDPAGNVLDQRTTRLTGSGRYVDALALDLAMAGDYTVELRLDGQPAAIVRLPVTDQSHSVFTKHVRVIPGDANVTPLMLQTVADVAESVAYPLNYADFGVAIHRVQNIVVYSNEEGYLNGLINDGWPPEQAKVAVKYASGFDTPQKVIIPYHLQKSPADLRDVVTHELFHAMIQRMGLGQRLPSWMNEGIAWVQGTKARKASSTTVAYEGILGRITASMAGVAKAGKLDPLYNSNAEVFKHLGDYNLEFQDFIAVQHLLALVPDGIPRYLNKLLVEGHDAALKDVFGITQEQLDAQVRRQLAAIADTPDHGVKLKLQLPDGAVVAVRPRGSSTGYQVAAGAGPVNIAVSDTGTVTADRTMGATTTMQQGGSFITLAVQMPTGTQYGGKAVDKVYIWVDYANGVYLYSGASILFTGGGSIDVDDDAGALGVKLLSVQAQ